LGEEKRRRGERMEKVYEILEKEIDCGISRSRNICSTPMSSNNQQDEKMK